MLYSIVTLIWATLPMGYAYTCRASTAFGICASASILPSFTRSSTRHARSCNSTHFPIASGNEFDNLGRNTVLHQVRRCEELPSFHRDFLRPNPSPPSQDERATNSRAFETSSVISVIAELCPKATVRKTRKFETVMAARSSTRCEVLPAILTDTLSN